MTSPWLGSRCDAVCPGIADAGKFLRERGFVGHLVPMESTDCLYSVQRVVFCPKRLFVPTQFLCVGSCRVALVRAACCFFLFFFSEGPFRIDSSP